MDIQKILSQYGIYISVLAAVATAVLQYFGIMVPDWAFALEGALGLTAVRTTVDVTGATGVTGWKTYASAAVVAALAGAQAYGFDIPDWVYSLPAMAGLGSLHVAVKKLA